MWKIFLDLKSSYQIELKYVELIKDKNLFSDVFRKIETIE